ncbi:ATP-binding protein [Streptomyces sp. CAU 1734]|uniref:ATP-binding protein n=1 Tax=Streptomyces sp. CAU 1734 TaxID=3140360 RepID=UPI003261ABDE
MDHDNSTESTGRPRPSRDLGAPDLAHSAPPRARTARLVSGGYLLTVNPVDGSEIELAPPGGPEEAGFPGRPVRRTAAERAEHARAAGPPAPAGPAVPRTPLLERDGEHENITRLLARGRSLRITGPPGSGRTALLDSVAGELTDLAPDGVVRLNGLHRTPNELLHELFAAVHRAPGHRPDRDQLRARIAEIGAVVVIDDLEFGASALAELLDAAPECAFLLAAATGVPEPAPESQLEEIVLKGLSRPASMELLRRTVDRVLAEDEENWAGDLWFESEGLPLRFVQAGALLRQCDELRAAISEDPGGFDAFAPPEGIDGTEVPLPTLGQGAAPAALLASRLGDRARKTLRFAVALGGEVPHQAHLPALIGDTHADAAIGELLGCGLLAAAGGRYRLAAGVLIQLKDKGYADDAAARLHTVARHYIWWAAHPSVTPERVAAEADAIVNTLTALVASGETGHPATAVELARSAAPAFAAGLHWGAWERVLRTGSEAARIAGEVAEEAYFHHELGILALCADSPDRARAELEASIALRGALSDKRGTVAGRRALALVVDRETGRAPETAPAVPVPPDAGLSGDVAAAPDLRKPPGERHELPPGPRLLALPAGPAAAPAVPEPARGARETWPTAVVSETFTVHPPRPPAAAPDRHRRRPFLLATRRNLTAASAGVLLAAVLGTVVTLGAASEREDPPAEQVRNGQSANEDDSGDGLTAEPPAGEPDGPDGSGATGGGAADGPGELPAASMSAGPGTGPTGSPSAPGTGLPSSPGHSGPPPTTRPPGTPSTEPTSSGPPSGSPSSPNPTPTTTPPTTAPATPTTTPPTTEPPPVTRTGGSSPAESGPPPPDPAP